MRHVTEYGLRVGQTVSHRIAGKATVDAEFAPRGYVSVTLSDGTREMWKIRQVRTKIGCE